MGLLKIDLYSAYAHHLDLQYVALNHPPLISSVLIMNYPKNHDQHFPIYRDVGGVLFLFCSC